MSRRNISPLRGQPRLEGDPRENIIRKLKEDLIEARGREKQMAILDNYLIEVKQKTRLLEAQTIKSDEEGRIKMELTQRTLNQLKKEQEVTRGELRNLNIEMKEVQTEAVQLNKLLHHKMIQAQNLKKEAGLLHEEKEKYINQHSKLRALEAESQHQIKKAAEIFREFESQGAEINRKVIEVKTYINQIQGHNHELKNKLKGYEQKNSGISQDIDGKEGKVDNLQRDVEVRTQQIKQQIQNYIQLQHKNQKYIKENQHRLNLLRIQNQKTNELTTAKKKLEKMLDECSKQLSLTRQQSQQIDRVNEQFANKNGQMKKDLVACHEHLENLIKHNAFIQQQMQNFLREDQAIINIIRSKRMPPTAKHYPSIRSSKAESRTSPRLYS